MVGGSDSSVRVDAAWERAHAACALSAAQLQEAGIAPDALAEYVPEHGSFLWRRKATMKPLGETWRLGTLLVATDGALYAHGHSTRAAERGRPSFQSESREERREIAAAALRGGFAVGTPVDFDAELLISAAGDPVDFSRTPRELPIGFSEGEVRVRWRAGVPLAGAQTLAAFLAERVGLLIDPPFGRD